jgi:hypothetical protein
MGSETNGWAVEKHGNRALVPLEQVRCWRHLEMKQ